MRWALIVASMVGCAEPGNLVVTVEGNGKVDSEPPGFGCNAAGGTCTAYLETTRGVELIAVPGSVSTVFDGWTGGCSGTDRCLLDGLNDVNVGARFHDVSFWLEVANQGYGAFEVTSQPAGIRCGTAPTATTCQVRLPANIQVTLTATWDSVGGEFLGWNDSTCGNGPTCTFTFDRDRMFMPQFDVFLSLQVIPGGSGMGVVTGPGIDCPTDCREQYLRRGDVLTLHAEPTAGSAFTGWSGPCDPPGLGDCTLTITGHTTIGATFDLL